MEDVFRMIQEQTKMRAQSYTPEWRFDMENPDIGSALAICYARMMAETVKQFSKVFLKNKIAFLNELGAEMLPAVPSHGYVQFTLISEEAEGVGVEKGTVVLAQDDAFPDGQVSFETQEDLYVTPAAVSAVYQTCDSKDVLYELYDREKKEWEPFLLFGFSHENIQKHEMYFSHPTLFYIKSEAYIEIGISYQGKGLQNRKDIKNLADSSMAVFEYYSENGWTTFETTQMSETGLVFYKSKEQPEFVMTKLGNMEAYWVRCRLLQYAPFSKLHFDEMKLSSWNQEMLPDTIFGAHRECDRYTYAPFGERLDLYDEVYFGSEEVLSKKGAQITFSYGIHFEKHPLDTNSKESMNWEWVMKKSDMKQETEFDVTIESVVWEYFNGVGWTRLFAHEKNSRAFCVADGKNDSYRTIQFICPDNIERILVNAVETYYIRARITKIENLYKLTGNYWIPVLDNTSFRYRYEGKEQEPQMYAFCNNLKMKVKDGAALKAAGFFKPFVQTDVEGCCMYLGFRTAPVGSPIKILFCIAGERECGDAPLLWEYWDGDKWKNLNPADETKHFSRTGLVIFEGTPDLKKKEIFGKNHYWIRIRETGNAYAGQSGKIEPPMLLDICMNTTAIENVHKREREFFQMTLYQEDKVFRLLEKNIYGARVYVDERRHLSEEELEILKRQNKVTIEMDADGLVQGIWVEWKQVSDFSDSGSGDRHFVINRSEGELVFGNGKHGRIPYTSDIENIKIDYCTKGGDYTNIPAGKLDRLERSIGYIHTVTNPKALTGGCNAETPEQAMDRTVAMIHHQNRAVSEKDYEKLTMCALEDVRTVRCFSGYDDMGRHTKGAVTIVVLPRQFLQGQMQFSEIRDRIMRYMKDKISAVVWNNNRFFVVPPELIEVRLHIELSVESFDRIFQVKRQIRERIERFFCPADSQTKEDGWEIGTFPNVMQIQNAINDIAGIVYIRGIVMSTYTARDGGKKEIDVEKAKMLKYVLPVNGEHEVVIIR